MKNNLKIIRESLGLTQAQLAARINTTAVNISRLEKSRISFTQVWIEKLCRVLNCTPNDLIGETDTKLATLIGEVGPNAEITPIEHTEGVEAPPGIDPDSIIAVRVKGEAMYPAYRDGDILYYHRQCSYDETCLRRECVVRVQGGAEYVKVLTKGSNPNTFTLTSHNSPPIEDVQIEWACKVLWIKKTS